MELIYFILGALTILWMNATYQQFQNNKAVKETLLKLNDVDDYSNATRKRVLEFTMELNQSMARLQEQLTSIQEQLDAEDLNTTLASIKDQLKTLGDRLDREAQTLSFANKSTDTNFTKVFNEVQALRNTLNKLGQDPNLMSRY